MGTTAMIAAQPGRAGPPGAAVVVDGWPLMCVGLARAASLAGLRVAGEARTLADGVGMLRHSGAGVLVSGDTDEAAVSELRKAPAGTLVAALLAHPTRVRLVELLHAGVAVVALRSCGPEELAGMLRQAVAGERVVAPLLVPLLVGMERPAAAGPPQPAPAGVDLTAKEREVLFALAAGASNQEIASQLYVTPATVKTHLAHIYAKLGVGSRHEALARAVSLGLIS